MIIDWPTNLQFKSQDIPVLVGRGASSGRGMTGAERVVSTDAGYWQLGVSFMLKDASDDLAWRAVLANLEGRSNVLRLPVIDVRTTPADLAGTRATLEAAIRSAGITYSDGTTHSDGTAMTQSLLSANATIAYAAGVTTMNLDMPTGYAPSIGQFFSDGSHLYQVKSFTRVVGRRYTVSFRPRLRVDAYDGSQFSFDRLYCLVRVEKEEQLGATQVPGWFADVSLTLVEAVS